MSATKRMFVVFWLAFGLASGRATASLLTIGPDGINSVNLTLADGTTLLDGSGIGIGQVEPSRPAMVGVDAANDLNSTVNPAAVFRQDGSPTAADLINTGIDPARDAKHAMQVAGVMISSDPTAMGVAPGASLYSAAHATNVSTLDEDDDKTMLAIQKVATQSGVRAVNHSYRKIYGVEVLPDGNDLLSEGIDWSAKEHNVLHVVSANNIGGPSFSPKANFNGMVIGSSSRVNNTGKYRQADILNLDIPLTGARTAIDLIAPGIDVQSTLPNNMITPFDPDDFSIPDDGTSLAAPHVTGTVALLQQYGDERIAAFNANPTNAPNWGGMVTSGPAPGPTARRHEVMKAVLMNSADKIKDDGNFMLNGNAIPQGKLLGMERTVLKQDGTSTWFDSDAYLGLPFPGLDFTQIPLDEEMGAGHLNAKRALQQFIPGEQEISGNRFDPVESYAGDVPVIGWDYGTVSGTNFPLNKYLLDQPLQQGDFISITLAWDREVGLSIDDGQFDAGDTFNDGNLTDLDLYLVPKGTFDIGDFDVGLSDSSVTPVEHIFTEIPFTGEYEIWVLRNEQFGPGIDYGLAWWYGLAPEIVPPGLSGDFDKDNDVDGVDFLAWQNGFGGMFNATDLTDWEGNFGMVGGTIVAAGAVPEPTTGLLLLMGLGVCPAISAKASLAFSPSFR